MKKQTKLMEEIKENLLQIQKELGFVQDRFEENPFKARSITARKLARNTWRMIRRYELAKKGEGNMYCEACSAFFEGDRILTTQCKCGSTNIFESLEE